MNEYSDAIDWVERGDYLIAHDAEGKVLGRVRNNGDTFAAWVGGELVGNYISTEFAIAAVQKRARGDFLKLTVRQA